MLYRYQGGGVFRSLTTGQILTLEEDDEEEPVDPEPQVPGTITHGSQLPATSDLAEQAIGAQGSLPAYTGPTDFTAAMGAVVVEDATINGNVRIREGANVTLRNCRVIGPPGSTTYTVRINEGGNARLLLEDCTVVCRSAAGATEGGSMAVMGSGDVSLALRRTVVRGGIDGIHFHGKGPAIWATGDPFIPYATLLVEECWVGDNERLPGSHSDLFQMAGNRPNRVRDYAFLRNRWMGYSISESGDTLTERADPTTSAMASACWINSTGNDDTGPGATHIAIRDSWFEGGNNVIEGGADAAPSEITGNLFAPVANFNVTRALGNWVNTNNRWAYSGTLGSGIEAVGGQLIPGSAA